MKITDLFEYERFDSDDEYPVGRFSDDDIGWDPSDDAKDTSFTIKEYDGVQPDDAIVSMFDIKVEYTGEDHGYTDHPYGEGSAREYHGVEIEVTSAVTAEEVTYTDPDTDQVIQTFAAGTDVGTLPGWTNADWEYVQRKAEEHSAK